MTKNVLDGEEIVVDLPPLPAGQPRPPVPPGTPDDVEVRWHAPTPIVAEQADLGVDLPPGTPSRGGDCKHRLVTIGDSLTQGFKSGAITDTSLSWPAIVAETLGLHAVGTRRDQPIADAQFTYPTFSGPAEAPGLPFNLEAVLRRAEEEATSGPPVLGDIDFARTVAHLARTINDYWEHGEGAAPLPPSSRYHHNLAVWGHDVRDALSKSPASCQAKISAGQPGASWLADFGRRYVVSFPGERTAIRTLAGPDPKASQVSAAHWLGGNGGIETLVVALGANNALSTVVDLDVRWSEDHDFADLDGKNQYTIWRPKHFRSEFDELVDRVRAIDAKHVIWGTVPHVTVAPLARGVGEKPYYSRYFARYTRPWIPDHLFDASEDECITGDEARVVDAAIDQYNYMIKRAVYDARTAADGQARDWYVLDLCGLLDRMAYRRYLDSPSSQPGWFKPYDLPAPFRSIMPLPDTRFFRSDAKGRLTGGLITLDGIHPTTVGYGIVAQEVASIMSGAGVVFPDARRSESGAVIVDFKHLIERDDRLIADPPKLMEQVLRTAAAVDQLLDFGSRLFRKA